MSSELNEILVSNMLVYILSGSILQKHKEFKTILEITEMKVALVSQEAPWISVPRLHRDTIIVIPTILP